MNQQFAPRSVVAPDAAPSGRQANVFVSYSRKDLAFAQMLVSELAARGFDAFLDKTDIAPGEPWKGRLAGLIAAADTVVFVVTPDSAASTICGWELEESARRGKRVIPIVSRLVADDSAPEALSRLNYIFCTDGDDRQAALAALDQALHTDLDWVREHTRLGELARRWEDRGRPKWAALRGVDLEGAERWLDRRPASANAPTLLHQDFIRASRRTATARQRTFVAGALVVALIAVGLAAFAEISRRDAQAQRAAAEVAKVEAQKQRDRAEAARREAEAQKRVAEQRTAEAQAQRARAERAVTSATEAANTLIVDITANVKYATGMPAALVKSIVDKALRLQDTLISAGESRPELRLSQGIALNEAAETLLRVGDTKGALKAALKFNTIMRQLVKEQPGNRIWQRNLAASLDKIGEARLQEGDHAEALAAYEESLSIGRAQAYDKSVGARRALSVGLQKIGNLKLLAGDHAGALAAYEEALAIVRTLPKNDVDAQRDLWFSLDRIGDVKLRAGDRAGALAAYQEDLAIVRALAKDKGNARAQSDLSVTLNRIGDLKLRAGDRVGALAAYEESLSIRRELAKDKGDAHAQRDLLVSLHNVGDVKLQSGDRAGVLAAYEESLAIARELAKDKDDAQAQRDLAIGLERIGDVKLEAGDGAGALAAFEENLAIARAFAKDRGDAQAQRDLSVALEKIGDVKLQAGDRSGALAAYDECLSVRRELAKDKNNAQGQQDLSAALERIGYVKLQAGDRAGALAAFGGSLSIRRALAKDEDDAEAQLDLAAGLFEMSEVGSDPVELLKEALGILQELESSSRLPPAKRDWIAMFQKALTKAQAAK